MDVNGGNEWVAYWVAVMEVMVNEGVLINDHLTHNDNASVNVLCVYICIMVVVVMNLH